MHGARLWSGRQLFWAALSRSSAGRQQTPTLRSFFTYAQPSAKSRPHPDSIRQRALLRFRSQRSIFSRRFRSDKTPPSQQPNPTPNLGSPEPPLSLSQRLRKLSKEYGYSAVGVYFALSALDFPFCFLAVRLAGADRIGHYEHVVVETFKNLLRPVFPNLGKAATPGDSDLGIAEDIEDAEAANQAEACM
jgi:hypothetical protein